MQRAAAVNGVGIAAYDHSKRAALAALGEGESLLARFAAAMTGGAATALVGAPFDAVKTRLMNQNQQARPLYAGPLDARDARVELSLIHI